MTINDRIFLLLKVQKKKQIELSKALGVRPNTISGWKNNRTNPDINHLEKLSSFFNVSIDFLVTGTDYQGNQQTIYGNNNSQNQYTNVVFNNGNVTSLTEIESELLKICETFDTKRKTMLLNFAYKLDEEAADHE